MILFKNMKIKKSPKRQLYLTGLDKSLELSKVSEVKVSKKEFIYLDKLDNGTWRLCYTSSTIDDIKNLISIDMIRN